MTTTYHAGRKTQDPILLEPALSDGPLPPPAGIIVELSLASGDRAQAEPARAAQSTAAAAIAARDVRVRQRGMAPGAVPSARASVVRID